MKNWLKGLGGGSGSHTLEIDDLIVLERYEEAERLLRQKIAENPRDRHARVKLAEVYAQLHQVQKALECYKEAATSYAEDGFHDKGIALLSKARKLAPGDPEIGTLMEQWRGEKVREHQRLVVTEALRRRKLTDSGSHPSISSLELERLWMNLSGSPILENLSNDQLRRLFGVMELRKLETGEILAEKGGGEAELYLVASGAVEAVFERKSSRAVLRAFGPGDIIGEAVLLEHQTWPATYRASSPSTVLRLSRSGLEEALVGNSDPRELLQILRGQHHDRRVLESLELLEP